jgi:hypothetical protein
MKRASYRDAIRWIAEVDDTEFLKEELRDQLNLMPISAVMVADIFGVAHQRVIDDLRRAVEKEERKRPKL